MSNYTLTLSIQSDEQNLTPDLCMIDGKAYCTSLQVAQHFEKSHDHVIRDIETTITQVLETSEKPKFGNTENLFKKSEYSYANNLGAQVKKPMYYLSEQGFTLLAMGYTGAKAMKFKLAYMAAFEKMRDALNTIQNAPYVEPETISQHQYRELRDIIESVAHRTFYPQSTEHALWNKLRIETGAETSQKIPCHQFDHAKALLKRLHDQYFNEIFVFMAEMQTHLIREHLCGGVPFTKEIRQQWHIKQGTLLPKPLNWKQIALQVMGDRA